MMNDPLGDMLTRIRNAQMRGKSTVRTPASKSAPGCWMSSNPRATSAAMKTSPTPSTPEIEISLKYYEGDPVIRELRRVSTPGRRVYAGVKDIPSVRQGLGVAIVSTPKGVMSDAQARADNVGGEVLCTVF